MEQVGVLFFHHQKDLIPILMLSLQAQRDASTPAATSAMAAPMPQDLQEQKLTPLLFKGQ